MRAWLLLAVLVLAACRGGAPGAASPARTAWATGFWFWQGSEAQVTASVTVDDLYVYAGQIRSDLWQGRQEWKVTGSLQDQLPAARSFWLVFRNDSPQVPPRTLAVPLAAEYQRLLTQARLRQIPIAGLQLDVDSPTGALARYGELLQDLRSQLPPSTRLSITALLDWFRPGTSVHAVLRPVDEFVPQFYDTHQDARRTAIAAPINASRWGPVFEGTGKPYRIGISSFGRVRYQPRQGGDDGGDPSVTIGDLTPSDTAQDRAFERTVTRSPAQELLLRYEAVRATRLGWLSHQPGDRYEFVLPTAESMRAAVASARAMGSRCAGVIFFRWPQFNEVMSASPDQALRAAGVLPPRTGEPAQLQAVDRQCAAVHCTDLYLSDAEPLTAHPLHYTIRGSTPLEYFVPAERTPARLARPDVIELRLPPYGGLSRLYLGRAVTARPVTFTIAGVQR